MDTREQVHDRMTHELEELNRTPDSEPPQTTHQELMKSYRIASTDERNKVYIPELVDERRDDPAIKV